MLLNEPGCGPAAAAAPQIEAPAQGAGQNRVRRCRRAEGRCGGDAPARHRRDGLLRKAPHLAHAPAAADDEGRRAAFLRRQLQAPALREIEAGDLAHHGAEMPAAQRFLERPERIFIAPHADQEQAAGVEPRRRQGTRIKIAPARHPQHAAAFMAQPAADEAGHRRRRQTGLFEIRPIAGEFVQRAQHEPAPGQMPVDGFKFPAENLRRPPAIHATACGAAARAPGLLFQQGDLPAQGGKPDRLAGGQGKGPCARQAGRRAGRWAGKGA